MTDKDIFEQSLKALQRHIEEDYELSSNTYIVALSRKGPRLLECLFGDRLSQYHVVTEYALPFLFKQLAEHQEKQYKIMIVDDAIYFGSTLGGVYHEILAYKEMYNIDLQVNAYTAIKSENAPTISGLNIICDYTVSSGYSHFFAKNVMAVIRGLHTSMEVDFPRICYSMATKVDIDKLYDLLQDYYPQKVYKVVNKENASVNILLKPVQGSFFNKIRIYVDGSNIHVVTMTPRVVIDGEEILEQLFVYANEPFPVFWNQLIKYNLEAIKKYRPDVSRSVKKVLVALADYIYSFNTFLGERGVLEDLFVTQFGGMIKSSIRHEDVGYLLGTKTLCEGFCGILNDFLLTKKNSILEYRINLIKFSEKEVYESLNFPEKEERETLSLHNMHMIRNSRSQTQALSAIFFNQTLLIERWSRKKDLCNYDRLHFGYTFQSISNILTQYARYEQTSEDLIRMHAWIDKRIDHGCIVPQYIIDGSRGVWTRVFRPGENEDVVLSHLARWVLSVYKYINENLGQQVDKVFFYSVLSYVVFKVKSLSKELDIALRVVKRGNRYDLMFSDESDIMTDVLDYLEKMYVLTDKAGFYVISSFLQDNDIKEYSTLSKEILSEQQIALDEIIQEVNNSQVPLGLSFLVFNYLFRDILNTSDFSRIIHRCSEMVLNVLQELEPHITQKEKDVSVSSEVMHKMTLEFSGLYTYLMLFQYMYGTYLPASETEKEKVLLNLEKDAYRLNIAITVIQHVYNIKDLSRISYNIKNGQSYYESLDAEKVRKIVEGMIDKGNMEEAYKDRSLLFAIRSLIINHVLNDYRKY